MSRACNPTVHSQHLCEGWCCSRGSPPSSHVSRACHGHPPQPPTTGEGRCRTASPAGSRGRRRRPNLLSGAQRGQMQTDGEDLGLCGILLCSPGGGHSVDGAGGRARCDFCRRGSILGGGGGGDARSLGGGGKRSRGLGGRWYRACVRAKGPAPRAGWAVGVLFATPAHAVASDPTRLWTLQVPRVAALVRCAGDRVERLDFEVFLARLAQMPHHRVVCSARTNVARRLRVRAARPAWHQRGLTRRLRHGLIKSARARLVQGRRRAREAAPSRPAAATHMGDGGLELWGHLLVEPPQRAAVAAG
eukprot:scaffold19434_cov114-Isochrysis_galbana.AAC.1